MRCEKLLLEYGMQRLKWSWILGWSLVILLGRPLHVEATAYYLDSVNGSTPCVASGHTGCNPTACKSWAALTSTVSLRAGDTINFCTGTYRETITLSQSGTAGNPITLKAATGAAPVLSALDLCTTWTADGSSVYGCTFSGDPLCANAPYRLFVDGAPIPKRNPNTCPTALTDLANVGYCSVYPSTFCKTNSDCTGLAAGSTCVFSTWCYDGTKVHVHLGDGSNPTAHTVEVGKRDANIAIGGQGNLTVGPGLRLYGAESCRSGGGFAIEADSVTAPVTVTGNVIDYAGAGMRLTTPNTASFPTISNNTISHQAQGISWPPSGNSLFGIRIEGGVNNGFSVTGNTFSNNGSHNWARRACVGGTNDTISCVTDTDCPGATCQGFTLNCAVSGGANRAICATQAISAIGPNGVIHIDDNTGTNVEDALAGVPKITPGSVIGAGSSVSRNNFTAWPHDASHNAFSTADGALMIYCATAGGTPQSCAAAGSTVHQTMVDRNQLVGFRGGLYLSVNKQPADAYSVRVTNNMLKTGDKNFGNFFSAALTILANSDGVQIYNNTVHCDKDSWNGGSGVYLESGAQAEFRNNILDFADCNAKFTDNSTLDTWNTADNICNGSDVMNTGHCSVAVPALNYRDAANNDFHLAGTDTAAINKGFTFTSFTTDIDGDTRPSGAWDIGADEYVTSTGVLGDLDGSGTVDALDLQHLVNVLLGLETNPKADLDNDGSATILDLQRLVNLLLGV